MEGAAIAHSRKFAPILQEGKTLWIWNKHGGSTKRPTVLFQSQRLPHESQLIGWLLIWEWTFNVQPWTSEAESGLCQLQGLLFLSVYYLLEQTHRTIHLMVSKDGIAFSIWFLFAVWKWITGQTGYSWHSYLHQLFLVPMGRRIPPLTFKSSHSGSQQLQWELPTDATAPDLSSSTVKHSQLRRKNAPRMCKNMKKVDTIHEM